MSAWGQVWLGKLGAEGRPACVCKCSCTELLVGTGEQGQLRHGSWLLSAVRAGRCPLQDSRNQKLWMVPFHCWRWRSSVKKAAFSRWEESLFFTEFLEISGRGKVKEMALLELLCRTPVSELPTCWAGQWLAASVTPVINQGLECSLSPAVLRFNQALCPGLRCFLGRVGAISCFWKQRFHAEDLRKSCLTDEKSCPSCVLRLSKQNPVQRFYTPPVLELIWLSLRKRLLLQDCIS